MISEIFLLLQCAAALQTLWSSADHALTQVRPRQIFTLTHSKNVRSLEPWLSVREADMVLMSLSLILSFSHWGHSGHWKSLPNTERSSSSLSSLSLSPLSLTLSLSSSSSSLSLSLSSRDTAVCIGIWIDMKLNLQQQLP